MEGTAVGLPGIGVGTTLDMTVGAAVGAAVGTDVGAAVSAAVGASDIAGVSFLIQCVFLSLYSAIYKFPSPSIAMPVGSLSSAAEAMPPSPLVPPVPVPAIVVIIPEELVILRILLL